MSIPVWTSETNPGGAGSTYSVMYLYSTSASDPMRLGDTGTEGCSVMAAAIAAFTDPSGNTYTITEQDATTVDFSTDLSGYDVVMTGSCNVIFSTTQRNHLMAWVNGGGSIIGYSDNGINGGGNTAADSRDSMGFDATLEVQFGPDQFDGVRNYTLPASSVLGNALAVRGEGTSPWAIENPYAGPMTLTVLNQHWDQTPGNTSGTTYSGEWGAIGVGTYGSGRVVLWFDRQMTWNAGAGSDITEVDNQQFVLNSIAWAATGISQA